MVDSNTGKQKHPDLKTRRGAQRTQTSQKHTLENRKQELDEAKKARKGKPPRSVERRMRHIMAMEGH